ncbi:MAG: DUF2079 domain-containing protein [Candidatus Lernaella stagnicola]|nr:DUF2079 domain-containing protein [Candidatus Lernaella stagnicola]
MRETPSPGGMDINLALETRKQCRFFPITWETSAFLLVVIAAIGYFLLFYWLNYSKWIHFDPMVPDIGSLAHIRATLAQGRLQENLVLTPGFYLLYPGLLLLPFPEYPLAISPFFTALSIIVLFAIALQLTKSPAVSLALAFSYLINPLIEIYSFLGFRPESPGIFFLFLFVYLALRERGRLAAVAAVLSMVFKIEFVPVVFFIALWFYRRKERPTIVPSLIGSMVAGAIYGAALLYVLVFSSQTGDFSPTITSPLQFLKNNSSAGFFFGLFSPFNLRLILLMFPVAFICLRAPYWTFVPAVFQLVVTLLLNDIWARAGYFDAFLIYPITAWTGIVRLPIVWAVMIYLGAAFGLAALYDHLRRDVPRKTIKHVAIVAALVVFGGAYHWLAAPPTGGPVPLTPSWSQYSYRYQETAGSRQIRADIDLIEQSQLSACLSWQYPYYVASYVENRSQPSINGVPCDLERVQPHWILVDTLVSTYPAKQDVIDWTLATLADPHYAVQSVQAGVVLLERVEEGAADRTKNRLIADYLLENRSTLQYALPHRELYVELLAREGKPPPPTI